MAGTGVVADGVLYQIYPRSFADSDGDGIGDLRGIVGHLDHLAWLGVDGIWLSPTFPSPNADWGYDVADYRDVAPRARDARRPRRARRGGGRARHPGAARPRPEPHERRAPVVRRARGDATRRTATGTCGPTPAPDGAPPNNWVSIFGGSAWALGRRDRPVLPAQLPPQQPDLELVERRGPRRFDGDPGFWYDRGIAGFRIDVRTGSSRTASCATTRRATEDAAGVSRLGQRPAYNVNRPEVHDVLRRWRARRPARVAAAAARRDVRPRPRHAGHASTARATTGCISRSTSRSGRGPRRGRPRRRGGGGQAARRRGRWTPPTTTRSAPDALGGRRRAASASR